jgi:hypothetical protein
VFEIRTETKAIKLLLKELYPEEIFSINLKQPSSYISNSDKIKIKCPKSINKKEVISTLKKYVYGIDVYEKGNFGYIKHTNNTSYIILMNGEKIDMDMVEFIEVQ